MEIISKSDGADEKRQVYHIQGHLGFSIGPNEKFYMLIVGNLLRCLAEAKADIPWSDLGTQDRLQIIWIDNISGKTKIAGARQHTQGNWSPWWEPAKVTNSTLNSAKKLDTKFHMRINIYIYCIDITLHMLK